MLDYLPLVLALGAIYLFGRSYIARDPVHSPQSQLTESDVLKFGQLRIPSASEVTRTASRPEQKVYRDLQMGSGGDAVMSKSGLESVGEDISSELIAYRRRGIF